MVIIQSDLANYVLGSDSRLGAPKLIVFGRFFEETKREKIVIGELQFIWTTLSKEKLLAAV